jgi:hypothetical protein
MPKVSIMSSLVTDAFVLAVVTYTYSISLAKLYAKRNGYKIHTTQVKLSFTNSDFNFPLEGAYIRGSSFYSAEYLFESKSKSLIMNLNFLGILRLWFHEFYRLIFPMFQLWSISCTKFSLRNGWC